MFHFRALLLGCLLLLQPLATLAADPPASPPAPVSHTIAVADFSGADPEVGRFIAETLLTDLAQSRQMHFAERSEIRRALDELKLQSTGLTDPQQITQLGKLVSADRLIVGSYMEADDQIIINARLLDVGTGRLSEGGAGNVSGDRRSLLSLVHRLSHQFHRRVTGTDFVIDGEGAEVPNRPFPSTRGSSRPAPGSDTGYSVPTPNRSAPPARALTPPQSSGNEGGFRVRETPTDTGVPTITVPPLIPASQASKFGVLWQRPVPSRIVPGRPYRIRMDTTPVNYPTSGSIGWRIQ